MRVAFLFLHSRRGDQQPLLVMWIGADELERAREKKSVVLCKLVFFTARCAAAADAAVAAAAVAAAAATAAAAAADVNI